MTPARTLAILAALVSALGCTTPDVPPAYVGSAACAECHDAEFVAWRRSLHADAARDGAVHQPWAGTSIDVASVTGRLVTDGSASALRFETDTGAFPVAMVLGRHQIEQGLVEVTPGKLQALPFGRDTVAGEWFDIFPERPSPRAWEHWRSRGMTANDQCIECHVTGFVKGYDVVADGYGSSWSELGVGCESCHGPRSRHVAARRAGEDDTAPPSTTATAAITCAACHARRIWTSTGYVPGADILEHIDFELLDTDVYHADGHLHGEGYEWTSFQMSRMGAVGVTCQDCHEPHSGLLRAEGNDLCLRCHPAQLATTSHTHHATDGPGSRCVACHMPEVVFMERDRRRDHHIAPPDPGLARMIGATDACTGCHTAQSQDWAAARLRDWFGESDAQRDRRAVAVAIDAARAGDASAVATLLDVLASRRDVVRRASAARLLAPWAVDPAVADALHVAAKDEEALVRASALRALADPSPADPQRPDVLLAAASDPSHLVRLEAGFGLRGRDPDTWDDAHRRTADALRHEWLAAQDAMQDAPDAHFNRGVFWEARGNAANAESAYRTAIRLWPNDIRPRQNLAMLLAHQDRTVEAEREFENVLHEDPTWAPAACALGVLLSDRGDYAASAARFEACVEAAPNYPRAAYNLGVVRLRLGRVDGAAAAFERAIDDDGSRTDALRELVRLAYARGDEDALRRWLPDALLADPGMANEPRVREALGR